MGKNKREKRKKGTKREDVVSLSHHKRTEYRTENREDCVEVRESNWTGSRTPGETEIYAE